MTRWFSRPPEAAPEVVERIEPIEIPIISEVQRRLARDEYEAAVAAAYRQVIDDLQRAYGRTFPPGWTQYEVLDKGLNDPKLGHLPEFVRRLTDLYVPTRFSAPPWPRDPEQLESLLRSIYARRPMWALYLQAKKEASRSSEGSAPSPSPRSRANEVA